MVHVERSGSGAPVLLLHGVAGSSETYGWLPDLGREVVRPDFRGHGRSPRTPGAYTLDGYVADALLVLRELGPAPVAGHSLGGVVGWTLAQREPELVTALLMEDPPLYLGEPSGHAGNAAVPVFRMLQDLARRLQAQGMDRDTTAAWLAEQAYGTGPQLAGEVAAADALQARAHALLHLDPAVLDAVIDGSTLAPTDVAAPVRAPVLIVAAGVAPAFTPAHERRLAETHPEVRVRRVAGATHTIHDESAHRAEYLAAVRELF